MGLDDTIVQQSVIHRFAKPDSQDLRELQDWLERQAFGNLALIGADSETWGRLHQPINSHADLLTLNSTGCEDIFSRWFSRTFIFWFHHTFRHRPRNSGDLESGIMSYSSRTIERYTSFVTTIVASLLPISSTAVLFCVPSMKLRLGLIVFFTLIFAVCVSSFTSAKRGEIFVATST
jgi:ABC-type multidrug transport system fused ATPase/permease subunit